MTSRMLPVKRTSGSGIEEPDGVQKLALVPSGHTTIRAKPSPLCPMVAVDERGCGLEQEAKFRGGPCRALALVVSQGLKAGTSETRSGEAPPRVGMGVGLERLPVGIDVEHGVVGKARLIAPVGVHDVELPVAVAVRSKGDLLPVRGEGR
jgi:hypothetical protein